ncbi:hypothetical protein T484DRAFT_1964736 [Baffinella frigidus]|nr:hypothetical protein T484DRAFT_1964736 [Cryptophyta sp. CCMP2293]
MPAAAAENGGPSFVVPSQPAVESAPPARRLWRTAFSHLLGLGSFRRGSPRPRRGGGSDSPRARSAISTNPVLSSIQVGDAAAEPRRSRLAWFTRTTRDEEEPPSEENVLPAEPSVPPSGPKAFFQLLRRNTMPARTSGASNVEQTRTTTLRKAKTLTSLLGAAEGFSRLDNRADANIPDWGVLTPGAADHMERYLRDHRQLVSPSAQETAQMHLQRSSVKLRPKRRSESNYGKSVGEEKMELIALYQEARAAGFVVDAEPLQAEDTPTVESPPDSPSWPNVSPYTPRKSSLEVIKED